MERFRDLIMTDRFVSFVSQASRSTVSGQPCRVSEKSMDLVELRRTLRHDLRTPINAIKGYGEMLREDAADRSAERFAADLDKLLKEANLVDAVLESDVLGPI
jgi:signal transduction histidine kinase